MCAGVGSVLMAKVCACVNTVHKQLHCPEFMLWSRVCLQPRGFLLMVATPCSISLSTLKLNFLCMFYLCFSLAIQLFVSLLVCLDVLDVPLSNLWFSLWSYSIVHSSFFCFVHILYLVQKTMYVTCA